jgi:HPt (histidine-containing phosphotransfer) domain-containing protein
MPPFDAAQLLRQYGDEALVRDLAELVVSTVPSQIDAVQDAVRARDCVAVRATVHKLRGSIASFALPEAVETARQLETMAAGGDLSNADELSRNLALATRSLCDSANAWLAANAPSA